MNLPAALALTALLACAGCAGQRAHDLPRAEEPAQELLLTPQGCVLAADMVLVARALSAESIERPRADRIMAHVYPIRPEALRVQMTELGYARKENPMDLAGLVLTHCRASGGRPTPDPGWST
jgi:hypothetical protein